MPNSINLMLAVVMGLLIVLCLVVSWRRADNITALSKEPPDLARYTVMVISWLSGTLMLYVVQALAHGIHNLIVPGK